MVVFIVGAIVAFQEEDRGPWMHGSTAEPNNNDQIGCSYTIWMTKTGRSITQAQGTCMSQHNLRGILLQADQKDIRVIGGHFYATTLWARKAVTMKDNVALE